MWMKNPDPRIKPPLGSIIDWSHPLADGLVGCWLFNEGGGRIGFDLGPYEKHAILGSLASWDSGYLFAADGNYSNAIHVDTFDVSGEFSVIIRVKLTTGAISGLWGGRGSSSGGADAKFNNLTQIHGDIGTQTSWLDISADANVSVSVGVFYTVVYTINSSGYRIFLDQNLVGEEYSYSDTPHLTQANTFYIGHTGHTEEGGAIYIDMCYVFNKFLPSEFVKKLFYEPYSFIVWPSQISIFDLAPGGNLIQRQAQAPLSWRRYLLKGAALNISSTIPAGRQAQAPVSYNKELSRLFSIPASMLLSVSKEGTALFEALDSVSREAEFPVDWFSSTLVVAGKEIPISAVRYVSKMADAPLEGLVVTEKARELSYSWLLSISRDAVIPTDWQGALLVTKDVVLPVDFARLLLKGGSTSLDWTHPLESPKEAVVEFLKMVQGAEAPFPLEVLSGLKEDITASLDWIRSVLSEKDLGPTWLVFRSIDEEVCLSWVVPVAEEKDFDLSWLKGIAKSAGLPVEVAGKAVRVEMLRFRPRVPRMRAVFRLKDSQIKLN